ncbi:hypothetical protein BD311DRAFT_363540 [Dichomitus squalens]|uniref:Uncharacterized protein n=1 Tax=Dichomitus squalens TaxID=114155 RepID=A0A4Q9MK92_9APHY|nr:hypothetical protein BD311DRAFT_363540 [Dichomitus squalens]
MTWRLEPAQAAQACLRVASLRLCVACQQIHGVRNGPAPACPNVAAKVGAPRERREHSRASANLTVLVIMETQLIWNIFRQHISTPTTVHISLQDLLMILFHGILGGSHSRQSSLELYPHTFD